MKKDKDKIIKHRLEVVRAAQKYGISETSRIFKISRPTITNWIKRHKENGPEGLDNLSKKHLPYPNRLPVEISRKIIRAKMDNPDISASEIKRKLGLTCSLTTVIKKMDDAGLVKKNQLWDINLKKVPRKIKPLENIFITTRKISDFKNRELPAYFIIAIDYKTGAIFLGYTFKNIDLTLSIFMDYLLENFRSAGIRTDTVSFIPLRKSLIKNFQKADSLTSTIMANFNAKFKLLEDMGLQQCRKSISASGILNFFKYTSFKTVEELMLDSFDFLLHKNYNICNDGKSIRNLDLSVCKLGPVLVDNYISEIDFLKESALLPVFAKALAEIELLCIARLRSGAYALKKSYQNQQALELFRKVLFLCNSKEEYQEITIDTLLEEGRILEFTGCYQKAEVCYRQALELSEHENRGNSTIKCCRYLAAYYRAAGDYLKSFKYYDKMLVLADHHQVVTEKIIALRNLGNILFYQSDYPSALERFDSSLQIALACGDQVGTAKALIGMSVCHIREGDVKDAAVFLQRAEKVSLESDNVSILMEAFADYGHYYLNYNDFPFRYLEKFKMYAAKSNDKEITMSFYKQLGNISITGENYPEAINYFKKGLLLAEETQHPFNICRFLYNIGICYFCLDKHNTSLKFFEDCFKIAEKMNFSKLINGSIVNMGVVYGILKKNDEALDYLQRSVVLSGRSKNNILLLVALLNLSTLFIRKKEYFKALKNLKKQLQLARKLNYSYETITAYGYSGIVYRDTSRYRAAEINFNKAIKLARQDGEEEELVHFLYEKAQLCRLSGKQEELQGIVLELKELVEDLKRGELKVKIQKMISKEKL